MCLILFSIFIAKGILEYGTCILSAFMLLPIYDEWLLTDNQGASQVGTGIYNSSYGEDEQLRLIKCVHSTFYIVITCLLQFTLSFNTALITVDVRVPMTLEMFIQNMFLIASSLLFVCLVFPYFLPILAVLAIIMMFIRNIFRWVWLENTTYY